MAKDYLNEYRNEIRKSYEIAKNDVHANFLINPSLAKLRDLCVLIFRDNKNADDLLSFRVYFGFDYTIQNSNTLNLQENLNKFKPISKFLKGESILQDIDGLNLAAMLVDFEDRPYNKFKKRFAEEIITEKSDENLPILESEKPKEIHTKRDEEETRTLAEPSVILTFTNTNDEERINKNNRKDKLKYVAIGFLILMVGFFGINYFLSSNKCMQWQGDHYEKVDCDINGLASFYKVEPIDEYQFKLKRMDVTDSTVCFRGKEPLVYYCKVNGKLELFNQWGRHPETGQILKPISDHMLEKYVYKTKK